MRLRAVTLLCFLAAAPAMAQSDLAAQPPAGQTLPKSPPGERTQALLLDTKARGETEEQREHYAREKPGEGPITSTSTKRGDD